MSTISTDTSANESNPVQPISISIQDIQNLLLILDTAAQRGAFKGNELSQIGQLFDKISLFVQTALSQQARSEQQPPNEPVPTPIPQPVMVPVTSPMMPPFAPKIGS